MANVTDTTGDVEEGTDEKEPAAPERPRLPIVSLAITAVFLALGGLLLYFVRAEVGYFFSSKAPGLHFLPTREMPLPVHPPSNVYAEARIDYRELCDFWDTEKDPLPPEVSYAFTLQMGMGKRYFLTCVGEGETRPRLWILRPESADETKRIQVESQSRRVGQLGVEQWTEERVPEIHIPGGPGCVVNDPREGLCRGRLVRFGEYAQNPLGGVRKIQDVLRERLEAEFRRLGRQPLEDGDYLLILGETPASRWWYVALLGGVAALTLANLLLGVRALRRYLRARRIVEEYLRRAGGAAAGKKV
ncbi:MAG: hypothetical protein HY905_10970 [Deltaproteobacteria bacterium]|nr:hypothetical protein [Deltaproteobacteria bacterium]